MSRNRLNPLHEENIKQQYKSMVAHYGFDRSTGEAISSTERIEGSRRLDGSRDLYQATSRLDDTEMLLTDYVATLSNLQATNISSKIAMNTINKSIVPLLGVAADLARSAANSSCPFCRVGYVHGRYSLLDRK